MYISIYLSTSIHTHTHKTGAYVNIDAATKGEQHPDGGRVDRAAAQDDDHTDQRGEPAEEVEQESELGRERALVSEQNGDVLAFTQYCHTK